MSLKNSMENTNEFDFKKRSIFFKIYRFLKKIINSLTNMWGKIYPDLPFRKGAAIGATIFLSFFAVIIGYTVRPGFWIGIDIPIGIIITLISIFIFAIIFSALLRFIFILHKFVNWKGLIIMFCLTIFMIALNFPVLIAFFIGFIIVFIESLFSGAIFFLFTPSFKYSTWYKKAFVILSIVTILFLNYLIIDFVIDKGSNDHILSIKPNIRNSKDEIKNPYKKGSYNFLKMTYKSPLGKKNDSKESMSLVTKTVNASAFLKGNKSRMKLRKLYWGFDETQFPINGNIWYPQGRKSSPLILMVHGNHKMENFSNSGFNYLGELLASRGFIAVSIDQSFLNHSWTGNLKEEDDARAWIILQHLKTWKKWNKKIDNPFFEKVDLSNIGLIGHSSGGNAIALAAMFNKLKYYPDNANIKFNFNFDIKSLIAIAPTKNNYHPSNTKVSLKNISYLLIQGAHDGKAVSLFGSELFNKISFDNSDYNFKSILYSYRSSHNRFNSSLSKFDYNFPLNIFLNKIPLLSRNDHQKLTKVYALAFFRATLYEDKPYISLFKDYKIALKWLPDDLYINRFEDSTYNVICNYEEDVDLLTGSKTGIEIKTNGLTYWREGDIKRRRNGYKGNKVSYIGWDRIKNKKPSYSIYLSDKYREESVLNKDSLLTFALADARVAFPKLYGKDKGNAQTDFTIEIGLIDGKTVSLPLSKFMKVPRTFISKITKTKFDHLFIGDSFELTLQSYELPLNLFFEKTPELDYNSIKYIRFKFDLTKKSIIIIDNIGFVKEMQFRKYREGEILNMFTIPLMF